MSALIEASRGFVPEIVSPTPDRSCEELMFFRMNPLEKPVVIGSSGTKPIIATFISPCGSIHESAELGIA